MADFFRILIDMIRILLQIYAFIIVARVFVSYFVSKQNASTAFIYRITEPPLKLFRKLLPYNKRGIDWSPLLVLIAIVIASLLLYSLKNAIS
ncbi:MAG: YggT family protein [Chloroflexi bacterium]|nr:YggT family protein [Chloroflexota bacterium]